MEKAGSSKFHTDLTRTCTSPIPPTYSDFEDSDDERPVYRSQDPPQKTNRNRSGSSFPPQPPLAATPDSNSRSNDHSIFPGSSALSYQTSASDSRNTSPAIPAEKGDHAQTKPPKPIRNSPRGDLDKIDLLDESDPFGFMRHRDALKMHASLANAPSDQRKPKTHVNFSSLFASSRLTSHSPTAQPQSQTHIPTSTSYTGGVLNLVPGQLMPKMPYQLEPPVDWVSPPPTVGRLPVISSHPDQYSYDPADIVPQMAPHPYQYRPPHRYRSPPQPLSFPSLASLSPNPNTVLSITNPDLAPPRFTPSVMTASTNNSKKAGKALPRHVPKKLVMPAPLQPLLDLNQNRGLTQENIRSTYNGPLGHIIKKPGFSAPLQYSGLTRRETQVARISGYYPPPMSQTQKSQHRPVTYAPPISTSDLPDQGDGLDRGQERERQRSRRQAVLNSSVGRYLEMKMKASTNGFDSSVDSGSMTTSYSGSTSRSGISV